jgi:dimethylamine/trimethylamine dehydrogenase
MWLACQIRSAARFKDIREYIGCNICLSRDCIGVPIRCTQNPTMAEASRFVGGRAVREVALPRMHEYIRVRDYPEQQLPQMSNVEIFP